MSHRDFAERYFAALMANDQNTMREMMHPDFVITEAAGLPYAGTFHGVEGWFDLTKKIIGAWAGFKIRPIEFLGETADTMVVRFAFSGRSRKTGTPFESTVLELWRFKDGKLSEIVPHYFDTHQLALADGAAA